MDPKETFLAFVLPQPTPRICTICGKEFVGIRVICDDKACFYAWQLRMEENRRLWGRPRDYDGRLRKYCIVTEMPEDELDEKV